MRGGEGGDGGTMCKGLGTKATSRLTRLEASHAHDQLLQGCVNIRQQRFQGKLASSVCDELQECRQSHQHCLCLPKAYPACSYNCSRQMID